MDRTADTDETRPLAWDGPRATAVLLVHGFTGTPWEVRPVAEALNARGFTTHAPLLPGHGTSPSQLGPMRWSDWSAAVSEHIERLRSTHANVVLVGASLGGLLVLDAAARHAVRGVVTLAAALRLTRGAMAALTIGHGLGRALPHFNAPKFGGSDIQDPAMRALNPGYDVYPFPAACEFVVGQQHARAALASLGVPLLAMHGLLDATTPIESSLEIIRRAGAEDVSFVVARRSGHLLGVDFDREQVCRQVCAFVERVAPG